MVLNAINSQLIDITSVQQTVCLKSKHIIATRWPPHLNTFNMSICKTRRS